MYAKTTFVTVALVAINYACLAQEFTFFVNKDSLAEDPTGLTWDDAFTMLQPAVDAADIAIQFTTQPMEATADIWIAEGVYDEERFFTGPNGEPNGSARGALQIFSNIALYGGFNGTESARSERDADLHPTIIDSSQSLGGQAASIGVRISGGSQVVLDSLVVDGKGIGGGVSVAEDSHVSAIDSRFINTAGRVGVAPGVSISSGSSGSFNDCAFSENVSQSSGAAVLLAGEAFFTNCLFQDNVASSAGGAIALGGGTAEIVNCRFINNESLSVSSGAWGGAINSDFGDLMVRNSLFFGNRAVRGAAIGHLGGFRGAQIVNCTFVANTAEGNSVIFTENGFMSLENSIFWDNQGTLFGSEFSGIQATIKDNLIQDLSDMSVTGLPDRFMDHNIEADPLFVNAAKMDFRLQPASPAIDIGVELVTDPLDEDAKIGPAPDEDIAGIMRPQLITWDLGMHEYRPGYENDVDANNVVNAVDVQNVINGALGLETPAASYTDTNFDNFTNAVDVQKVINAALGIHTK